MLLVIGNRRQYILRLLRSEMDGLTVDQIAAVLRITRSGARDHIRSLERDGLVAPSLTPRVTGGRPGTRYRLTPQSHALFPKNYDGIARLLLETLVARLGQDETEEELRALGKRLAGGFKARVGKGPMAERAAGIAKVMEEIGFAASSSGETIEARNCIYHEMAQANPTICHLDVALIGELADARVEHRSCMARGDRTCTFCLKK